MIETIPPPEEKKMIDPSTPLSFSQTNDTFTIIWDGENKTYNKKDLKFSDEHKKGKSILVPILIFIIAVTAGITVLLYQGATIPSINLAQFILSPNFNWFIATIGSIILLGPFGIYGIYKFYSWLQNDFLKLRGGYIKVRKKLSNDRWQMFWKKPIGNKITAKTEEGIPVEIPIRREKDYMNYEGNAPFIELDENLAQFPMTRTILTIPKEHSTRMSYLAYLAGKISAWKEQSNLQLLLIIAIVVLGAIGGFSAYTVYQIKGDQQKLSDNVNKIDNIVSGIQNRTSPSVPSVSQVPTVGG